MIKDTRRPNRVSKLAYLGTWLLFVAIVLYFDWTNARVLEVIVGLIAFPGVLFAGLWVIRGRKWVFFALGASLALLVAYAYWWISDIAGRYAMDPDPGIWTTSVVQLRIWVSLARHLIAHGAYLNGSCQLYWGLLMPLLQLAFLPVLVRSARAPTAASPVPAT